MQRCVVPITREKGQQIIKIPKKLGFKRLRQVEIVRVGDELHIHKVRPRPKSWLSLLKKPRIDFEPDRTPIGDPERFLKHFQ